MKVSEGRAARAKFGGAWLLLVAGSTNALGADFSYNGDAGPAYWPELSPEWSACAGAAPDARQSPVDIVAVKEDRNLKSLSLISFPTSVHLTNNGHTIEQEYEGSGTAIFFEGRNYELLQFHFHTLSEHAIAGEQGDMELHAVFQHADGTKLVIGMLFEVSKKTNPFIQTLINAGLPRKSGDTTESSTSINLADVLTNRSAYFTYPGSLTTPPCTENVTWIVLAERAHLSQSQFESFRRILGNDFRPLQRLNGRVVRATDGLPPHARGK